MTVKVEADVVVIGSGPGGYVAAIRAAQLGSKVVTIEKGPLGGTCTNCGCIPTKAFVESANRYRQAKDGKKFGLNAESISFDFAKIQKRKQQIVNRMAKSVGQLLESNSIQVLEGLASFVDTNTIKVTGGEEEYEVNAPKVIIATGSKPGLIPEKYLPGISGEKVITSDEFLEFTEIPESVIVIGGGVIGLEAACILATFGCKVRVVEMLPKLVPMEDDEIGEELEKALKKLKIKSFTNSKVTKIEDTADELKCVIFIDKDGNEQKLSAEFVLVAVGRAPQLEGLNLEVTGIKLGRRGILVNNKMETNIESIYAIGDVIEGDGFISPMLAYTASMEGEVAAESAVGKHHALKEYHAVPSCIFTHPECSSVGLREAEAREKLANILVGRSSFMGLGKAIIAGENRGFVKVILNGDTHQFVGCHIIGPHATELIAEAALVVQNRLKAETILQTEHCHPVLYEAIKEATLNALGRGIHG